MTTVDRLPYGRRSHIVKRMDFYEDGRPSTEGSILVGVFLSRKNPRMCRVARFIRVTSTSDLRFGSERTPGNECSHNLVVIIYIYKKRVSRVKHT